MRGLSSEWLSHFSVAASLASVRVRVDWLRRDLGSRMAPGLDLEDDHETLPWSPKRFLMS